MRHVFPLTLMRMCARACVWTKQEIRRIRRIRRTADDPVDVFLFADVVVSLPVTRLVRWELMPLASPMHQAVSAAMPGGG